jgi:abequosyltransferase
MNEEIYISFCIPTLNRGKYIEESLMSILSQDHHNIEIVIVDGGSKDDTQEIVSRLMQDYGNIKYIYNELNGGLDADLFEAISHAEGKYCWIMSSDDIIEKNSINHIIEQLNSFNDVGVILCNRTISTVNMQPIQIQHWLSNEIESANFDFTDDAQLKSYLSKCNYLGGVFSYAPSIIFRRKLWVHEIISSSRNFFGSNYAHVNVILAILLKNLVKLRYIHLPIVNCRGDNDSFSANGLFGRLKIDYSGYYLIGQHIFSDKPNLLKEFLKIMKKEHKWPSILKLRLSIINNIDWINFVMILRLYNYNPLLIKLIGTIGSIKFLKPIFYKINEILK